MLELPVGSIDSISGEVKSIEAKGNKERCAWISAGAKKHVRAYLRLRPQSAGDERLWLQDDGKPLSI